MPLDIQTGGFAEKIRRALGVRGRMPLRLDETVVPVTLLEDLSQPPFRHDAKGFSCHAIKAAVAAVYSMAGIRMAFGQPGVSVVDQISFYNGQGTNVAYSLVFVSNLAAQTAFAAGDSLINCDNPDPGAAGATRASLPVQTATATSAVAPETLWFEVARVVLAPATSIVLPVRFALRGTGFAGQSHDQALMVVTRAVNLPVEASYRGTYYPAAP